MSDTKADQMAILYNAKKCTGCNACVLACKAEFQWPSGDFANRIHDIEQGTYPNVKKNFIRTACMHCTEATCMLVCPSPGAIVRLDNGVVFYDSTKCIGCQYCVGTCPFGIPFYDESKKKSYKCSLCEHRISEGKEPACVATCISGALSFGKRSDLVQYAKEQGVKTLYGEYELQGLHALYALQDKPTAYGLDDKPKVPASVWWWHTIARSFALYSVPLTILGCFLHYVIHGPHIIKEKTAQDGSDHE
ncbi:MAG: 4Fe-4S dicluster domain-containing protein [bacterium]